MEWDCCSSGGIAGFLLIGLGGPHVQVDLCLADFHTLTQNCDKCLTFWYLGVQDGGWLGLTHNWYRSFPGCWQELSSEPSLFLWRGLLSGHCLRLEQQTQGWSVQAKRVLQTVMSWSVVQKDPQLLCGSLADVSDMAKPAEVAGEDDTKEHGFIDHFQGFTNREVELWEGVILLREVELDDLSFLVVNSHVVLLSEFSKICQLVLEDRLQGSLISPTFCTLN